MRVKFLTSISHATGCHNLSIEHRLKAYAESHTDLLVVEQRPDVVHLIGQWTERTVATAQQLAKRKLPVVFTSADGLQSIVNQSKGQRRRWIDRMQRSATFIHVGGPMESKLIEEFASAKKIRTIANPDVTSFQTEDNLFHEMLQLYHDATTVYDANVRQEIAERVGRLGETDPTIANICSLLLYEEYQVFRQTISQVSLDLLSQVLTASQYDEERLADNLKKLNIHDFTARLMQVAATCSTLTEGFMPVMARTDKHTQEIISLLQPTSEETQTQSTDNQ